jgi:hypothetical protein
MDAAWFGADGCVFALVVSTPGLRVGGAPGVHRPFSVAV